MANILVIGGVTVAELAEWSLPTPEDRGLNPVFDNFYV